MEFRDQYVICSLELHLFFARIMKEHALFLEAGFTPRDASFAGEAAAFRRQFEKLLQRTVQLSDGIVGKDVLCSGEVVTEFTSEAERQTQRFTGIHINREITAMESRLRCGCGRGISRALAEQVQQLNRTSIRLLDGLIAFKEKIINNVSCCRMLTMNYPLLIEHILREAKLYRMYVFCFENDRDFDCQSMQQIEQFWNQIMMEHALFIRGLLDPSEEELIQTSNDFAGDYARLLETSRERNDCTIGGESLAETLRFRDFKATGTKGISDCKIRSIILPLLADHVLREANHYIRLLED